MFGADDEDDDEHDSAMSKTDDTIQSLEGLWKIGLPGEFRRLYSAFRHPFISPCEFMALDGLLENAERWNGMLPQFIPFGHDGTDNFYGFYAQPYSVQNDYPILYWDHEYDNYCPIASGFGAFLRWCVIHGRYLTQDSFDDEDPQFAEEEEQRREFARVVGLPRALVLEPLPRNDSELYEKLARSDPQGAQAMLQLGTVCMGHGDNARARDFFSRASESTPWFADPYYLIAEAYRRDGNVEAAIERWWRAQLCPLALSTRTPNYDLGSDHLEAEVFEAAVEQLRHYEDDVPNDLARSPLGRLIFNGDPFESSERLVLASALSEAGDRSGEERELLNALSLSTSLVDTDEAYDRLVALYESQGRRREAEFCRFDRRL
jgi:tetratricopeptide (TPR) repeat protein